MGKLKQVIYSNLDIINTDKGPVYKGLRKEDEGFKQFGETYFSFVNQNQIKGWKFHKEMTCNLICISGAVKIILCDLDHKKMEICETLEFILSREEYGRLFIPPGIWFGIKGLNEENIVLNVADMVHNDTEVISMDLHHPIFQYINW